MNGYIKITASPTEEGNCTEVDVELKDISFSDRTCLLNAFLQGLKISHTEAMLHLLALKHGLVHSEERKEEAPNE